MKKEKYFRVEFPDPEKEGWKFEGKFVYHVKAYSGLQAITSVLKKKGLAYLRWDADYMDGIRCKEISEEEYREARGFGRRYRRRRFDPDDEWGIDRSLPRGDRD